MKNSIKKLFRITTLTMIVVLSAFATNPKTTQSSKVNWNAAEKNYIAALCSENIGLRNSAANFIAEYRLTGAVQPLIERLREDKVEQVRMASALALVQLGVSDGIVAVKEAAIYDGSEKVAKFCEQLINSTSEVLSLK
ncbi:MAG: HEAT repeat domain-containing protein [Bacteroidota bacterium]|nr:HEAT repeat domain-containing protein [Bacteroidota bacterium]